MPNTISEGFERILTQDNPNNNFAAKRPSVASLDLANEITEAHKFKLAGDPASSRAISSIQTRGDLRLSAVLDSGIDSNVEPLALDRSLLRQWADLDASEYGRLRSPERKETALEVIASNMRSSPDYASEIEARAPALADAAHHINAERMRLEKEAATEAQASRARNVAESLIAARSVFLDAQALSQVAAVRKQQAEQVAASLFQQGERQASRVTPDEKKIAEAAYQAIDRRNQLLTGLPPGRLEAATAALSVASDLESLRSIKKPDDRYFAALMMADSALSHSSYRTELHKQNPLVAREVEAAGKDNGRPSAAKEDRNAAELGASIAATAQKMRPVLKRHIIEEELSDSLRKRYIIAQERVGFLNKGQTQFVLRGGIDQGKVGFLDSGKNITTERQDQETVRAMIEVATAKGWGKISVDGTDEFKRLAWLEASLKGIEVRGFEPKEADKKMLVELSKVQEKSSNLITRASGDVPSVSHGKRSAYEHINADALTPAEKTILDNGHAFVQSHHGKKFADASIPQLEARLRGERVYRGELIDHGPAPYDNKEKNAPSYYVTLRTNEGDKKIWGKELHLAMQNPALRTGDAIELRNVGKKSVTVTEKIFDDSGKYLGAQSKGASRNEWTAELIDKSRNHVNGRNDLESARALQPTLSAYDLNARRTSPEPTLRIPEMARITQRGDTPRER